MKLFFVVWGLTGLFAWGKITGHLDWSWWLVFVPVYVSTALGLLLLWVVYLLALMEKKK